MHIDRDVKSATRAYDFSEIDDGSSIWFPTKGEAMDVHRAFTKWARDGFHKLGASVEKCGVMDPRGKGYRIHFLTMDDEFAQDADTLAEWILARTKPTPKPPYGGWHLVSVLHADYERWFTDAGKPASSFLSIVKFSQKLAATSGVKRMRQSEGSVAVGIAFKEDEIFSIHRHSEASQQKRSDASASALQQAEERRRALTFPCRTCKVQTPADDLNNVARCKSCVAAEKAEQERIRELGKTDPDAALRAKLEAKRKADGY